MLAQGGFSGSALELDIAAPALGLRVTHREAVHASSRSRLNALLDAELGAGRPVVVGVDLHPGQSSSAESGADHFILIYGQRDGRYLVVDPAGGACIASKKRRMACSTTSRTRTAPSAS